MNTATRIALIATVYLAKHQSEEWTVSDRIVAETGAQRDHVFAVLGRLVKAKVVKSKRHCGYRLARPAQKISLAEIVEAMEGPIEFRADLPQIGESCFNGKLEQVLKQAADKEAAILGKVNLKQLIAK